MSDDCLHRFLFEDLAIRGAHLRLGPAWQRMCERRNYPSAVIGLLGELTAIATLIADALKRPGRVSFQLQGHGPINLLLVDCNEQLQIRGLARSASKVSPASTPSLLGDGCLTMTLQYHDTPQLWQSIVPLSGDTVAEIFRHYLEQSEQQPALIALTADHTGAAGLLLQKLPDADERDRDGWNRVQTLTQTLRPSELMLPTETLLGQLYGEENLRLFDARPASYHCPRDEAKVLTMIRTLGREEVERALASQGALVIRDEVCNEEYCFGHELLALLADDTAHRLH